jgi:hypothetical protein
MLEVTQCISAANRIQRNPYDFEQCLVRASLSFRKMFFTFEKASSMGEKSGE